LDRLLRFKPALTHTEKDSDGEPEDAAADEFGGDGDGSGGDEEGGYGGRDPRFILGRRLLRLGKVNYRHIEGMPEWLQEVQRGICSNRTVPQIRRCLEKWMIKSDRELQERYRDRRLVWRRDANSDKAQTLVTYGPEETVAYAHYFLPARYALAKRILSETKTLLPGFRPRRVLDFGCGPATVGAALAEVWGGGAGGGGCAKYTGVDISRSMLDAAKGVMQAVREAHGTDRCACVMERHGLVCGVHSPVILLSWQSNPSHACTQSQCQRVLGQERRGGAAGRDQGRALRPRRRVLRPLRAAVRRRTQRGYAAAL